MPTIFIWKGRTEEGALVTGETEAESEGELLLSLRKSGIIPRYVKEKQEKKFFSLGKVSQKDILFFTRQFATLFASGVPVVQAFDALIGQIKNKNFKKILIQMRNDIEKGSSLADSMRRHPRVFSSLFVNMVRAGEEGGMLDKVLQRMADYFEKMIKLKRKIIGAMIYPSLVIAVAILVVAIIMIFVIPTFAKLFAEMGLDLPLPTRITIAMSNFMAKSGIFIFLGIIIFFVFVKFFRRSENGRKITDSIFLRIPVLGTILLKASLSRFSRTLGTLLGSGVPILNSMEISARASGNKVIEDVVIDMKEDITAGKSLTEVLKSKPEIFPPIFVQMVNVGESTGATDEMLNKVADFYDEEVDNAVANLMSMLEPALIVFLGVTIGFIVVSLYLPIFKLGEIAGKGG
ncbi:MULTISPECIES: type II secretion system F family protein [Thermodesulfovibrio]|uniref:Type IV pilin n=2 Tax=Thermodesulfovibrio yellowstonii TaxID=28262 RepID=B5YK51_THEYD|nr:MULTISPECIES: type II secretion system F family protein [Thermodesulfovibrio]ACI22092.1 type IV pilin [Thermodesulfovibrio yellowstonii DSM 11347]MDI6865343.1 type II secretion system F family protein [Thermodesulfovibrio yellowstonii]GLI53835.1 type II secretion system protein F [Thermodesulfovibrio islandicus]